MKQLTRHEDIIGKNISNAVEVDINCKIVLIFNDETFFVIESAESYGNPEIQTFNELSAYEKKCAGIISDVEFERIESERKAKQSADIINRDLARLAKLKAKYKG